jgi:chromosome partitioning protein
MPRIVSFINYKGGVGKTTLAVEISAALAHHYDFKVLLLDLDPQTNATFYLMSETEWNSWQSSNGTLKNILEASLTGGQFDAAQAIKKDLHNDARLERLHLLPSHLDLMLVDLKLAARFGAEEFFDKVVRY